MDPESAFDAAVRPLLEQTMQEYLYPALRAAGVTDPERYRLVIDPPQPGAQVECAPVVLGPEDEAHRTELLGRLEQATWEPLAQAKVKHTPGCLGDRDEGVMSEVSSNAAPGINLRSYARYVCTICGMRTEWKRADPWRFKYPDEVTDES